MRRLCLALDLWWPLALTAQIQRLGSIILGFLGEGLCAMNGLLGLGTIVGFGFELGRTDKETKSVGCTDGEAN